MRLVIGEDSVLLRQGVVHLLEAAGHEVLAAVGDPEALIRAVRAHKPDLSVVDVRMPPNHSDEGIQAARSLRQINPSERILVLSQVVSDRSAAELLASGKGGIGYLLKDRIGDVEQFFAALETVAAGGEVIDPHVVRKLLRRRDRIDDLTPREVEVLGLMAQGQSNTSIARHLVVSDAAVAKHVNRIFAKLGLPPDASVHRRVQAVLTYLRR